MLDHYLVAFDSQAKNKTRSNSIKKKKLLTLMVTAIFDVPTASNVHLSFKRSVIAYNYLYEALSSSMCLSFHR